MRNNTKEHLARELSQVALACLATATGGLFADPALAAAAATTAAGASTALGRLLDRMTLGLHADDYIASTRAILLDLAEQYPDPQFDLPLGGGILRGS